MTDERIADLRVDMTACRVDKESRLSTIEEWKNRQNGELRRIRQKSTATLIAIILLLIGVVTNLAIDRVVPAQQVEEVVHNTIERELSPIVQSIVQQILESTAP